MVSFVLQARSKGLILLTIFNSLCSASLCFNLVSLTTYTVFPIFGSLVAAIESLFFFTLARLVASTNLTPGYRHAQLPLYHQERPSGAFSSS